MSNQELKNTLVFLNREIHVLSLIILLALDLMWMCFEGISIASLVGIFLIVLIVVVVFLTCFTAVALVQHTLNDDDWNSALTKGFVFGIIAAIPLSFVSIIFAAIWGVLRLLFGTDKEVIQLGKLTANWRELEKSLRSMAPEEMRKENIDDVIRYLHTEGNISTADANDLNELRKYRNVSTHEYTPAAIDDVVTRVTRLRYKFNRTSFRR